MLSEGFTSERHYYNVFDVTDNNNFTSGHLGLVMKSLQGKVNIVRVRVCVCLSIQVMLCNYIHSEHKFILLQYSLEQLNVIFSVHVAIRVSW